MIRLLKASDVDACLSLSAEAGWNQTEADWLAAIETGRECCWGLEDGGELAGTTTVVNYSGQLAWIGMVLVRKARRRRGIARRLMEHALSWCDEREIPTVKLDATDLGRPLYLALGFEDEQAIERWGGAGMPGPATSGPDRRGPDFSLDGFERDRRALLERLTDIPGAESIGIEGGFALTRDGANARFLGPLVAKDRGTARRLVEIALAGRPSEPFFWDLLPEHPEAASLAAELGFARKRQLMRMVRPGGATRVDSNRLWAAAGFEYG